MVKPATNSIDLAMHNFLQLHHVGPVTKKYWFLAQSIGGVVEKLNAGRIFALQFPQ